MKSKNIIITIIILIGLISCRKDIIVPDKNLENLFGTWSLVSSSGGPNGETTTPTTENKTIEVEYKENGIYKKFINNKKVNKMTFKFEKNKSIYSSEEEYLITYSTGKFSKKGVVSHSFYFIGTDTLILQDECYDGYSYTYVRKN